MKKVVTVFVSEYSDTIKEIPAELVRYRRVFEDVPVPGAPPMLDAVLTVMSDLAGFGFGGRWHKCYGNEYAVYRTGKSSGEYIQIAVLVDYKQ